MGNGTQVKRDMYIPYAARHGRPCRRRSSSYRRLVPLYLLISSTFDARLDGGMMITLDLLGHRVLRGNCPTRTKLTAGIPIVKVTRGTAMLRLPPLGTADFRTGDTSATALAEYGSARLALGCVVRAANIGLVVDTIHVRTGLGEVRSSITIRTGVLVREHCYSRVGGEIAGRGVLEIVWGPQVESRVLYMKRRKGWRQYIGRRGGHDASRSVMPRFMSGGRGKALQGGV
jgi:hypothetical protein